MMEEEPYRKTVTGTGLHWGGGKRRVEGGALCNR